MAAGGAGELGLSRSRGSCPSKTCLGAGGTAVYHGACAIDRQDTHKLGRCSPWAKNLLPVVAMNCALCVDMSTRIACLVCFPVVIGGGSSRTVVLWLCALWSAI